MGSHYKIKNTLKNIPFYSEEIKKLKKKRTKNLVVLDFYLNYHFFLKNLKNKQLISNCQKHYHFFQKDLKDLKD